MVSSLYRFSEVEAKTAKPTTIYNIIENLLRANDDACYIDMERYLRGSANTGSSQFDHAHAVRILMDHDKQYGGRLHIAMQETNLSEREVWDRLNRILVKAGFKFHNGKMVGLLIEDQRDDVTEEAA